MLESLIGSIQWICLFIEGCIFLYMYYNYRKNKKSNEIVMKKKTNQIILVLLVLVNIILLAMKIIKITIL